MKRILGAFIMLTCCGFLPSPAFSAPLQGRVQANLGNGSASGGMRHPSFRLREFADNSTAIMSWGGNLTDEECKDKINDGFFNTLKTVAHDALDQWQSNDALPAGWIEADVKLLPEGAKIVSLTGTDSLRPVATMFIESIPKDDLAAVTKNFGSLTVHVSYDKR